MPYSTFKDIILCIILSVRRVVKKKARLFTEADQRIRAGFKKINEKNENQIRNVKIKIKIRIRIIKKEKTKEKINLEMPYCPSPCTVVVTPFLLFQACVPAFNPAYAIEFFFWLVRQTEPKQNNFFFRFPNWPLAVMCVLDCHRQEPCGPPSHV